MEFLVLRMGNLLHQMILKDLRLEKSSVVVPYEWQVFLEGRKPFVVRNGPILTLQFARSRRLLPIGLVVEVGISLLMLCQANWLVNDAIENCTTDNLGVVVMDELHMIDDYYRGYLMELMATKLLTLGDTVQLIGMSATLSVCQSHAPVQLQPLIVG